MVTYKPILYLLLLESPSELSQQYSECVWELCLVLSELYTCNPVFVTNVGKFLPFLEAAPHNQEKLDGVSVKPTEGWFVCSPTRPVQ
jgi:hypothetical protein